MAKFTKEAVAEKIKGILKTTGGGQEISDRTINDTLENLMIFANEEIELEAFVAQIQGGLISMNGNMRREVKEKLEAIPKPTPTPLPTPAPIPVPTPTPSPIEEPEWAKKIRERFEAQELAEAEKAKKAANSEKVEKAKKLLEAAGAKNKKVLDVALSKIQVTDEMTDAEISTAVLPIYNTEFKEFYGDSQVPVFAVNNATPEAKKELRAESDKLISKALEKVLPSSSIKKD